MPPLGFEPTISAGERPKTSGIIQRSKINNNPKDININQQHCEKLKSRNAVEEFDLVKMMCRVNEEFFTNIS